MLVVETIARIRREYFVKGKPIKEIVRDVKVSRNTVRKVIRSQATAFTYDRRVQPMPKLGPWTAELERMLEANETKSKRERLTLLRISEALEGLGYGGGYDAVRRYAKAWRWRRSASTAQTYVPLVFSPGEAYQFRLEPRVRGAGGGDDQGQGRRTSGCATAECSSSALIRARARRWCSTPTTGHSGCSRVPAGEASTTT